MTRTEYKRQWRENNRERYLAKRRVSARAWYARHRERQTAYKRAMRKKARDRGRCGICITRYCEPGFKTCNHCLDYIARRRQIRREAAAWE